MTNTKLIEATMKKIETFFKLEGFPLTLDLKTSFKEKVENWYNHTEITDAETLAAVTLSGDFKPGITIKEIEQIKEFFFPHTPPEYIPYDGDMMIKKIKWEGEN